MTDKEKTADSIPLSILRRYFDDKFNNLDDKFSMQFKQIKEESSETSKHVEELRKDVFDLKNAVFKNKTIITDLEKYKQAVDVLPTILQRLDSIEDGMDTKKRNKFTIAVAILSPVITTAILAFITWVFLTMRAPSQVFPLPTTSTSPQTIQQSTSEHQDYNHARDDQAKSQSI